MNLSLGSGEMFTSDVDTANMDVTRVANKIRDLNLELIGLLVTNLKINDIENCNNYTHQFARGSNARQFWVIVQIKLFQVVGLIV